MPRKSVKPLSDVSVSTQVHLVDMQGRELGSVALDPVVFDGKINHALMHQAVVTYLSNQRHGLAATKTRAEVSGGGRKPWRQKGTGRARAGSNRSPLWRKGGTVFGPQPHSFYKDLPKRMKALALKSALNSKVNDSEMLVLDTLAVTSNKTKEFFGVLKNLKLETTKVKFVVDTLSDKLKLSCRNLAKVTLETSKNLTTYETLDCKKLVFTKSALKEVEERVKKWLK
ncbi:MAG: 50S ribosomal protein L4 [Candidatus Omnitrophota bacterium]